MILPVLDPWISGYGMLSKSSIHGSVIFLVFLDWLSSPCPRQIPGDEAGAEGDRNQSNSSIIPDVRNPRFKFTSEFCDNEPRSQ